MSDLRSLYLVTKDKIIIGKNSLHRNLANEIKLPHRDILGGGEFIYSQNEKMFLLYGESYDFGKADKTHILDLISNGEVYEYGRRKVKSIIELDL